jgi:hypothetical protein
MTMATKKSSTRPESIEARRSADPELQRLKSEVEDMREEKDFLIRVILFVDALLTKNAALKARIKELEQGGGADRKAA